MPKTHGGILAGGAGLRLGLGIPKALAPLAGLTLLERAIATLSEVCDTVTVSMSPARPLPAALLGAATLVVDPPNAEGPLAGLIAALSSGAWDRAIVLGVDFPLARPAALRELLSHLEGNAAVLPAPGGRLQPLLAAYSRAGFQQLATAFADGRRSVVGPVTALGGKVLDDATLAGFPGGLENWFNVNTPADLVEAARRLEARKGGEAA